MHLDFWCKDRVMKIKSLFDCFWDTLVFCTEFEYFFYGKMETKKPV